MSKYLATFFLLLSFNCYAQFTITGRVVDNMGKHPLSLAVAFLNKTGLSTTTNAEGIFSLKNVPAGHYRLLIDMVGYKSYETNLEVSDNIQLNDIELRTKVDSLNNVTIKRKAIISPYYYTFKNDFLGSTLFARQCKILNPWAIHFYNVNMNGDYSAKSDEFIEVENDALGYKIKILLNFFTRDYKNDQTDYGGESYFEEITGTPAEEKTWQKNRMECYHGSVMQFLRAVLGGTTLQQGFVIKKAFLKNNPYYDANEIYDDLMDDKYAYKIKNAVIHEQDIVARTNKPGLFALTRDSSDSTSCLYIHYHEPGRSDTLSSRTRTRWIWSTTDCFILFKKPIMIFDYNGIINTRENVKFIGFLEEGRIANQLPTDFEPTE